MSNKHASKQHGLQGYGIQKPSSKDRKRRNKAKAAERRVERLAKFNAAADAPAPKKAKAPAKKEAAAA